jgi:tRNA A-37 threonylcarbamoyl transferase component Bud32
MNCFCGAGDADGALLAAASAGDAARVVRALKRGACADARDATLGGTPLALAALHGHLAAVRALLLHAAPELGAQDRVGDTAVHWAALNGHASVVQTLLTAGADGGARNFDGDTALDMAGRGVGVDAATAERVRTVLRSATPRGVHLLPAAAADAAFDATHANAFAPAPSGTPTAQVGSDWQIDAKQLRYLQKVAAGSFGDVYRGTYRGAEVAIKALRLNTDDAGADQAAVVREFMQELGVLRRVRHKHVVQLIGAAAGPPACVLVTEYMAAGSLAAHLRRQGGPLPARTQTKLALDVARGMEYLHACAIVHRDLKAANLLLNEHNEAKVADFGLARVLDGAAASMTAETGTYRWMAPEVVTHERYDAKCDVYSFGIVLWEIASGGAVPYAGVPALRVALEVAQAGLRPAALPGAHPPLAATMAACWDAAPAARPEFAALVVTLEAALADAPA